MVRPPSANVLDNVLSTSAMVARRARPHKWAFTRSGFTATSQQYLLPRRYHHGRSCQSPCRTQPHNIGGCPPPREVSWIPADFINYEVADTGFAAR